MKRSVSTCLQNLLFVRTHQHLISLYLNAEEEKHECSRKSLTFRRQGVRSFFETFIKEVYKT